MKVAVIDTETTDKDEPGLIEFATCLVSEDPSSIGILKEYEERFKPEKKISLGAMAVHHIMDEDLVDCRPSSAFKFPTDVDYIIGHNVDFDWKVIGSPEVKRICTLALCRELLPQADSHTLAAMFYLLERSTARERLKEAHSAMADVKLCLDVLRHIIDALKVTTWEQLWAKSEAARVPSIMPFGKHKGIAMVDVPRDYKNWLMGQDDVDPYLMQALTK